MVKFGILKVNNCIKNIISKFILRDKLLFSAVPWSMTGNLNMAKKGTGQWTMATLLSYFVAIMLCTHRLNSIVACHLGLGFLVI